MLVLALTAQVALGQSTATEGQEEIQVKAGESLTFVLHLESAPTSADGQITYFSPPLLNNGTAYPFPQGPDVFCPQSACGFSGAKRVQHHGARIAYPNKIVTITMKEPVKFRAIGPPLPVQVTEEADVTVNPTQKQLLRLEGARLQRQVGELKAAIVDLQKNSNADSSLRRLLSGNVERAVSALYDTEIDFEKDSTDSKETFYSKAFFDDLRINYDGALKQISETPRRVSLIGSQFHPISQSTQVTESEYPVLAQATLRAFDQNQLAYSLVVDSGSLVFDLEVTSTPTGAAISYFRRGDRTPTNYQDPTNATIHDLPYAVWITRFQKAGYRTEEREHNPMTDPNHVVHVDLHKSGR